MRHGFLSVNIRPNRAFLSPDNGGSEGGKWSSLYFAEVRRMSADEVCELFTRKNICLASQRAESTYILERVFSRFLLK